jgi:hypothetical protein
MRTLIYIQYFFATCSFHTHSNYPISSQPIRPADTENTRPSNRCSSSVTVTGVHTYDHAPTDILTGGDNTCSFLRSLAGLHLPGTAHVTPHYGADLCYWVLWRCHWAWKWLSVRNSRTCAGALAISLFCLYILHLSTSRSAASGCFAQTMSFVRLFSAQPFICALFECNADRRRHNTKATLPYSRTHLDVLYVGC